MESASGKAPQISTEIPSYISRTLSVIFFSFFFQILVMLMATDSAVVAFSCLRHFNMFKSFLQNSIFSNTAENAKY